jgi:hypothetical protein
MLSVGVVFTPAGRANNAFCAGTPSHIWRHSPQSLLQLQRVVLQNPGKANAIGKAVTCVQAFWFCSQCIARLNGNLAVSLLELNTFAHCISALLIYIFWWDKPYDVETLTFVESNALDFWVLLELSALDKDSMVPVIFLSRASGRTYEASGTYTISDAQGNHLIRGRPLIYALREGTRHDGPSYPRTSTGLRTRIPSTGLYLSFEMATNVPDPTYISLKLPVVKECWDSLWSAWVKFDRPLPPEPIAQSERWLYRRTSRSPNLDASLVEQIAYLRLRPTMCAIMALTFLVYGGLHLLAWQYNFNSTLERYLWRISAVTTASAGSVLLTLYLSGVTRTGAFRVSVLLWPKHFGDKVANARVFHPISLGLLLFSHFLVIVNVASRAFLVIESFIALPNSPHSAYRIPSWTAYIPHI